MRVSIVIPVWNLWQMTATCLRSLAECSTGENMQVVVVDNGSSDATATELDTLGQGLWGKNFLAIHLPENQGFARACNAGARAADGEALLFLNNDTTLSQGWLGPLRQALAAPRVGAVGPLLLYPDGTAQHCGIVFSPLLRVSHLYEHFPGNHPLLRKKRPLQAITGAAIMLLRTVFMEHGGFHEGYVNGCEDMDLCFALIRQGLRLAVAGESVVYHHTSQTPGRFEHDTENGKLLYQRWEGLIKPDLHLLAHADGYSVWLTHELSCRIEVSGKRADDLAARLANAHDREAVLQDLLTEEPLWLAGWLSLAAWHEERGDVVAALKAASRAMLFFPDTEVQSCTLRLLRKLGDMKTLEQTLAIFQAERDGFMQVVRQNTPVVQKYRRDAYARGDSLLGNLLSDWLERFGKAAG